MLVFSNTTCELGEQHFNKGMDGKILRSFLTLSRKSPSLTTEMTFDEIIYQCEKECLKDELCTGIQVSKEITPF